MRRNLKNIIVECVSNSAWSRLVMLWCVMMLVDRMEAARPVIVVTGVMTLVATVLMTDDCW